jgi:hypothetical protein
VIDWVVIGYENNQTPNSGDIAPPKRRKTRTPGLVALKKIYSRVSGQAGVVASQLYACGTAI